MKRSLFLAIAAIALVAVPRVSSAQLGVLKPFQLGIAGGATQPMSDLKTSTDIGYNGTVAMAINLPFIPVGLRVDGAYNQFGQKAGVPAKLAVASATGNVVWRLPSVGISPYLIGGATTSAGTPALVSICRCRFSMRSSKPVTTAIRSRVAL